MNMFKLEEIIIKAKKQYDAVFSTVIGEDLFVWRLLTHKEIELIDKSSIGDKYTREELICQYAVIYPDDIIFASYKAGIPEILSSQILNESGFSSVKKIYNYLDEVRADLSTNFISQASIAIVSAFPQYKFEEIEEWDVEKFITMAARAEWKLQNIDDKKFGFRKTEETDDNEADILSEKDRLKELEQQLVEMGADPILCLYEDFYKKDKPYTELPFIMGKNWDREDVCNAVTKSLSQRYANK